MKYPQLVSTRAVSAISDWLVTQLEQLGVDASTVYSRLLLSLLHTPLQINALDLAEISDNKVGSFARNKLSISKSGNGSNYRRFSAADTEALKRLAAIDSLLEAVPSDQQLSKIESLVDELSLKLREIEEQNGLDDSVFEIGPGGDSALVTIEKKQETSDDPANRYFSAFPALSDQTSTAFAVKTTSWPQVNSQKYPPSQESEDPSSSTGGAVAIAKKKPKRRRVANTMMTSAMANQMDNTKPINPPPPPQPKMSANPPRNSRTVNNNKTQNKKKTSEMWDTEFDGAWEMGRDLIREFVMKQNNRNRSISESDAVVERNAKVENGNIDLLDATKTVSAKKYEDMDNDEENLMRAAAAATSALFGKNFDMNLYAMNVPDAETVSSSSRFTDSSLFTSNNDKMVIRSDGFATPDTLASWSEIETAGTRRERDQESMACSENVKGFGIDSGSDCVDSGCDENTCLAAFKAKFNHNVEALWNDCKQPETNAAAKSDIQMNHSFWSNYNNNNSLDKQSNRLPKATNDQFKPLFKDNQFGAFQASGSGDKQPFITQPNSLNSNSSSTTGGMNLTTSIWTDNPSNNEDDISFYANARLWEMNQSKSLGQKFNFHPIESATNAHSKTNTMMGAASSTFDTGNYESASFSKWSDTEIPFLPVQQDARMSPQMKNDEKIRKYLFGTSYFDKYQSSQSMNCMNSQTMDQAENNFAEYSVDQSQNVTKCKVTLVNHSQSSCFKEVEPLSFEAKQELYCMTNARKYQATSTDALEHEDLLTSERSRFRPIKQTYADGYTFDISNKLDQISYERSKSGMLYHDSEVYREYYVYDEEGNGGSRCDTNTSKKPEFTLKYCVRQNDKSCQTDDTTTVQSVITPSRMVASADSMPFGSLSSANNNVSLQNHRFTLQCNDSNEDYMSTGSFDKFIEMSQDSWGLPENRQCCSNNNNTHALWEHCATCSNEMISMPADSLLKDELSADGDEIMSDLKFLIQSISFRNEWEDKESDSAAIECNDDDIVLVQALKPQITDASRNALSDVTKLIEYDDGFDDANSDDLTSNHIYSNVNKLISDLLQPEKARGLVQAISEKCQGRLFADDKSDSVLIHETKDDETTKNVIPCNSSSLHSANANSGSYFGSLWAYNDNSIWRKEQPNDDDVEGKQTHETKSANRSGEQWEHANLEKIWKCIPTSDNSAQDLGNTKQSQTATTATRNNQYSNANSMANLEQKKTESNTLEKFMNLIRQQSNGEHGSTNSHQQNHNGLHKNITRYDRKRRHSATSQNYFDQLNYSLMNCDTIENIKKLATKTVYNGANIFDCEPNDKPATTTIITCKYWTACDAFCFSSTLAFNNNNNNNNNNDCDTDNIFNCYHKMQSQSKYDPDGTFNTNGSIAMHPTTFLAKQVAAMVSRPLTR